MDYMSNKALVIAVSLIITMGIASAVLYTINQVIGVYKQVYETDTLIQSNFDEFDAYDGAVKTELDLNNTLRKYLYDDNVAVVGYALDEIENMTWDNLYSGRWNNPVNPIIGNLRIDRENNNITLDTTKAAKKYNTYIKRFDDNKVVISFR